MQLSRFLQQWFPLGAALGVLSLLFAACAPAAAPSPTAAPAKPAQQSAPAAQAAAKSAAPAKAENPKLAEMIMKAAEEREIVYQAPDPANPDETTDNMLRDISALVKKQFGVDVSLKIDNALSFPASTAKALTEIKSGSPPTFDLMYNTSVAASPLYAENAVEEIPWRELFPHLGAEDMEWKGKALINHTQFVLPEYNTRLVKAQDVPKTWDDLLDQKWKGKLGALIYMDPWVVLAQPNGWGKEKTIAYTQKLSELDPKLGRFPEAHERVLSGETPMGWGNHIERAQVSKEAGAPVDFAGEVGPAIVWVDVLFVPKGARHPNAAALVGAAMLTEEGQQLQEKYMNATSMFRPNTPANKFAQEHETLMPDVDWQLQTGNAMRAEFEAILVKK